MLDTDIEQAHEKQLQSSGLSLSGQSGDDYGSTYLHSLRSIYWKLRSSSASRSLSRKNVLVFLAAISAFSFLYTLSSTTRIRSHLAGHASSAGPRPWEIISNDHRDGAWPDFVSQGGGTTDLCDICDCETQPNIWAPKPRASGYWPRALDKSIRPAKGVVNRDAYIRQSILDIYCGRQHMSTSQTTRLVRRTATHLDQMVSWNVTGLDYSKPTVYLTTNTSPNGKANHLRPQFFRRHARTILDWQNGRMSNATNTTLHGTRDSADWQVLWLIVEDELDIDPQVVSTLHKSGVQFMYYAYGPTNGLGHAQRNAAMQSIYALSQKWQRGGVLGHGPVYCLDDDNKILPELLTLMTRLKRIGVFPVGNFGVPGGYEIPILSPIGEVMGSNSPWPNRTYPFDNAGFAFNSDLLGTQISGPTFWKWNEYGGESQFIEQVISDVRQLEPLCGKDMEQNCHYAWHNEPLTELQMLSDQQEAEFIERYGKSVWQSRLEEQLRVRQLLRGY